MENKKYFIGLDIGTDSVGYAATYLDYSQVKKHGEPLWGTTTFEAANLRAERRGFRTARRRLNRRQNRVALIQELFAREIAKIDPDFFVRIRESNLFREDKTNTESTDIFFDAEDYNDADFHREYPTIHHLISELMNSDEPHDVRMVYIACAWLVAHRGHFLSEVSKENLNEITSFEPAYNEFIELFLKNEWETPWECDTKSFSEILKEEISITAKEKKFYNLLFGGKKPKDTDDGEAVFNRALILKLISGGKVKLSDLYFKDEYSEIGSVSLAMPDEEFVTIVTELDEDGALLLALKGLYDWSILTNVLKNKKCISDAKIEVYNQHKKDLQTLKMFVKKYLPQKYNEVFRDVGEKLDNYVAYAGHYEKKNVVDKKEIHKATKEAFSDYLKKLFKDVECKSEDEELFNDMVNRISLNTFLSKQVDGDNRVIPYQLYYYELKTLLAKTMGYLPFLSEKDSDGISVCDKILSVFEFRVPYFIGPLSGNKGDFAWFKRKTEGKIYPWNFEKIVDMDMSEQEFIRRMTNTCSYLPGEYVLPKYSMLYSKFEVLNVINNVKINGQDINVKVKQKLYTEYFSKQKKMSAARIKTALLAEGVMTKEDSLTGIDMEGNNIPSLKAYLDFKRLIEEGYLSQEQAESIIEHSTYSEDRYRYGKWIEEHFSELNDKDKKYLSALKYKNFGRLSKKLLCGINGICKETGEVGTILDFMWDKNENLMQLLSDRYTFAEEIQKEQQEYYGSNGLSLNEQLDSMYISNSVKRPIIRALDIIKDIVSTVGYEPEKIFVEMARGATDDQKHRRTSSRKQQLIDLYAKIDTEDVRELSKQLEDLGDTADNQLQSDALFLYFTQLGKCMYSGKNIDINSLKHSVYNIDHIYPQSYVKDDSILNNKVLVDSRYNGAKDDEYPLKEEWRSKMQPYWHMLNKNGLITDEKYKRLVRSVPFTAEEKLNFINRQLTETQQSTKAIAAILNEKYKNTEIVYVKAGLVSEFRKKYDMLKCRSVNDLHHAKDAYLNIVVGNVYNERFTKKWFNVNDKYSLNNRVIFGNRFERNGMVIWEGEKSIEYVKGIMRKNNIHLTRYPFCRKGGLFDQMPVKAAKGLVPLKKNLDPEKYGGYNKTSAGFFTLVSYNNGKKKDVMIMPVENLHSKQFLTDEKFAVEYAKRTIKDITNKEPVDISFPLNKRILKINTMFSLDGFNVTLGGKSTGGKTVGLIPLMSLIVPYETEKYIKSLERFAEKKKKNSSIVLNKEYDKISAEKNLELYDLLTEKFGKKPYSYIPNCQYETLSKGRSKFIALDMEEQVNILLSIVYLFKSGRSGGSDLKSIGGSAASGVVSMSSSLSNWTKKYSDVRIIDTSASGIHTKQSENLLELL